MMVVPGVAAWPRPLLPHPPACLPPLPPARIVKKWLPQKTPQQIVSMYYNRYKARTPAAAGCLGC
jgi:hypothetical protein